MVYRTNSRVSSRRQARHAEPISEGVRLSFQSARGGFHVNVRLETEITEAPGTTACNPPRGWSIYGKDCSGNDCPNELICIWSRQAPLILSAHSKSCCQYDLQQ